MKNSFNDIMAKIRDVAIATLPVGSHALLFGSRARGEAHKGSDWDILILLNKETLENSDYEKISYPFVMLGCDLGEEINPIMYTAKEWDACRITPFYENVRKDAITVI